MEYYRVENYNSNVWEAVKILDSLNEAIDRMPPYDRIYVRGHYMLTDLLNEYKELFNRAFVMDEEDEQIDYDMSPDDEHFLPVEFQTAVVRCPYIQAQQWCCEE